MASLTPRAMRARLVIALIAVFLIWLMLRVNHYFL